jgi:hypothetical protein
MLSLVMLWLKYKHIAMNKAVSQTEKRELQVYVCISFMNNLSAFFPSSPKVPILTHTLFYFPFSQKAMITLATLHQWMAVPAENEHIEFKEAKQQFDSTKLLRYCVALANEGGGYVVLGVTDKLPRSVVGSKAFLSPIHLNDIKARIVEKLRIRVEVSEMMHPDGRVKGRGLYNCLIRRAILISCISLIRQPVMRYWSGWPVNN